MCCTAGCRKALLVVAVIVLLLGLACVGVGLWAIADGHHSLVGYLSSENWVGIKIIGGLLVGAGVVLIIDFVLWAVNSTKVLSGCCQPLFFTFTLLAGSAFIIVGILALTVLGDMLRVSLHVSFKPESEFGVSSADGPLAMAQVENNCCGVYRCSASNSSDYTKYNCGADDICLQKEGCMEVLMKNMLPIFKFPLAIGAFVVAGVTILMFILSLIACCCT